MLVVDARTDVVATLVRYEYFVNKVVNNFYF